MIDVSHANSKKSSKQIENCEIVANQIEVVLMKQRCDDRESLT